MIITPTVEFREGFLWTLGVVFLITLFFVWVLLAMREKKEAQK